ncbi:MAG: PH domain-containing protein [Muribaculaceae bacterium]|nr:PH domain-containing protein [Muribaculaceae bacterium]
MIQSNVKYSAGGMTLSTLCMLVVASVAVYTARQADIMISSILILCLLSWLFAVLWYAPLSLRLSDTELTVHRPLFDRRIALADIVEVKLVSPTMAERCIIGCRGLCGYWGWFSEPMIGRYFAYYGKASDCFVVKLRSGRRYMLSCERPEAMVSEIAARIN